MTEQMEEIKECPRCLERSGGKDKGHVVRAGGAARAGGSKQRYQCSKCGYPFVANDEPKLEDRRRKKKGEEKDLVPVEDYLKSIDEKKKKKHDSETEKIFSQRKEK